MIDGTVKDSVMFNDVVVGKKALVKDSVIFPEVKIGEGAVISRAIIGQGVDIAPGAKVGTPKGEIALVTKKKVKKGEEQ